MFVCWRVQAAWNATFTVRNARAIAGLDGSNVEFVASNEHQVTVHVVTIDTDHGEFFVQCSYRVMAEKTDTPFNYVNVVPCKLQNTVYLYSFSSVNICY